MVIKIDFQSEEALYMQLRNQSILGIATSVIQEGDSLPSVRQPPPPLTERRTPAIPTASSSISRTNAGRKTLARIWTGTHYSKPKPFIKDIDYGTCC